jgi:hypothetical protein
MGVKPRYIVEICRPFCAFFREGEKEDEACGGVLYLDRCFSPEWCRDCSTGINPPGRPWSRNQRVGTDTNAKTSPQAAKKSRIKKPTTPDRSLEHILRPRLCGPCPFREGDCDFFAGRDSPPCGGYVFLATLIRSKTLTPDDLPE